MIYLAKEDIEPIVNKIMAKLDEILRYQKNFDSEIFCSLSRQEEKIDLANSNSALTLKTIDKFLKKVK